MSCPSCQVAGRRLPPFFSSHINKSQSRLSKSIHTTNNESGFSIKTLQSEEHFIAKMQTDTEVDCKYFISMQIKIF